MEVAYKAVRGVGQNEDGWISVTYSERLCQKRRPVVGGSVGPRSSHMEAYIASNIYPT